MSAIYRACVGCNLRYASADAELCDTCYPDYYVFTEYQTMKESKGGKGRVPMPPSRKIMEDSRTQRTRTRGDNSRATFLEDLCIDCGGSGKVSGSQDYCLNCDGTGWGKE